MHGHARRPPNPRPPVVCVLVLAASLGPAGGCAAYPYVAFAPRATPALGELRPDHALIDVLYATDRRDTGSSLPSLRFGIERAELSFGACRVSIPAAHGRGRLEQPPPFLPYRPAQHVALSSLEPLADSHALVRVARARLDRSPRGQVLLFVHGYNVSFAEAARRTAQIAHDIEFDGVPVCFSWPAQGYLLDYLVDATNAEWAEPHLTEFLRLLAHDGATRPIHLLAHSMGNRLLVRALRELMRDNPAPDPPPFDQIILAAADIDAEIFERDFAPSVSAAARHVTVYVSANDWALLGSNRLHKYARLGQRQSPNSHLGAFPNLRVVDATPVDHGIVGHMYYGESPTVLDEIRGLVSGDPDFRHQLKTYGPRP